MSRRRLTTSTREVHRMTRVDELLTELTHETRSARRHLERLPDERFDWRPHPKSVTAGERASHIVECVRWAPPIFSADELDLDERPYQPFLATSVASLLEAFDAEVDAATRAMTGAADTSATLPWSLKMGARSGSRSRGRRHSGT
jgi:hypothetical protein